MTNQVPFLDLAGPHSEIETELATSLMRVAASNNFILGDRVVSFESQWAEYCDVKHAVGVGNGLDALFLILRALGVGAGDEVIVPANTFVATWLAVTMCGAVPVAVEPVEETFNIDPALVERVITTKTKAIIAVHLYGQPADLDNLLRISRAKGIPLVEDAAQAHGALHRGKRIGGHGTAVAWSFYPGKNLGAFGDAGAITTNDAKLAGRLRLLRNYGSVKKYNHEVPGVNSRLDEIQAAVLSVKLPLLDEWNRRRRTIAEAYLEVLNPLVGVENANGSDKLLAVPVTPEWAFSVWHLFVVRVANRAQFMDYLAARGIETSIHYPTPPGEQEAFRGGPAMAAPDGGFSSVSAKELVSLPIGPHLDRNQVEVVQSALVEYFSARVLPEKAGLVGNMRLLFGDIHSNKKR